MTKTDIKTGAKIVGFVTFPLQMFCEKCAPVSEFYQADQDNSEFVAMWDTDDFAKGSICSTCNQVIF